MALQWAVPALSAAPHDFDGHQDTVFGRRKDGQGVDRAHEGGTSAGVVDGLTEFATGLAEWKAQSTVKQL